MKFLALTLAVLSAYAPISGGAKKVNTMSAIEKASVLEIESDIVDMLEQHNISYLKEELFEFLKSHGTDNEFNRKLLQQFFVDKTLDNMIDTVIKIYAPISAIAKRYATLDRGSKSKVSHAENKILKVLEEQYDFSLDFDGIEDFIALIRNHGSDTGSNRKLLRRFFTGSKSKIFDQIAVFVAAGKKGKVNLVQLRRALESNPNFFEVRKTKSTPKNPQKCTRLSVSRQKNFLGGKKI